MSVENVTPTVSPLRDAEAALEPIDQMRALGEQSIRRLETLVRDAQGLLETIEARRTEAETAIAGYEARLAERRDLDADLVRLRAEVAGERERLTSVKTQVDTLRRTMEELFRASRG